VNRKWLLGALAGLLGIGVAVGLVLALGDDEKKVVSGTSTSSSSTTSTTAAPATTQTPVTVAIVCTTPEDATKSFVQAWMADDKPAAERCATHEVTDKLFENDGTGAQWTFQGCFGDPGVPTCSYSYEGGAANFTLNGTESGGWKVVDLSYVAD
jgi:hypothetical protein